MLTQPENKSSSQTLTNNHRPLRVLLGTTREVPFSENIPTNVLETFLAQVLGQLTYSTGAFEVEPGLIESWTYDFKANEYKLTLKKDLVFHNGRPANAADLEFSLVRHLLGKYGSWFRSFFSNIQGINELPQTEKYRPGLVSGIRVINDRTLAVRLSQPNPSFLHSLARSYFSLVPIEELQEDLSSWKTVPIGVGPYRIALSDRTSGFTQLTKFDKDASGPDKIDVFMDGTDSDIDISIPGPRGQALESVSLRLPSGLTLLNFNYKNAHALNPDFRNRVRAAIHPELTDYDKLQLHPSDQLLPKHFWGRVEAPNSIPHAPDLQSVDAIANRSEIRKEKILVYDSGSNSPTFFSFLDGIQRQLEKSGIPVEFVREGHKYERDESMDFIGEISTLGCDVMDPLVLFGVFREGSPLGPYIPPRNSEFERLFELAAKAQVRDDREATVRELALHFERMNYAIPLFERYAVIAYNKETIASLGKQNGSLILYLNRVELK